MSKYRTLNRRTGKITYHACENDRKNATRHGEEYLSKYAESLYKKFRHKKKCK